MFLNYFSAFTMGKYLIISDLLFLVFAIIIIIVSGSYLAVKNKINFALGKIYALITLYSFICYTMLTSYFLNLIKV